MLLSKSATVGLKNVATKAIKNVLRHIIQYSTDNFNIVDMKILKQGQLN